MNPGMSVFTKKTKSLQNTPKHARNNLPKTKEH